MTQLPIRTQRLTLRAHTEADAAQILKYQSLPEVARYLLEGPWTAEVAPQKVAERMNRTGLDTPARAIALVVEHNGEIIGDVSIWLTDKQGKIAEIGWIFDPGAAGHGYATEAARALIDYGFDDFGLHRIAAQMDARNTASARVAERLGMRCEAQLRQDWWVKEEFTDTTIYAILANDPRPPEHAPKVQTS